MSVPVDVKSTAMVKSSRKLPVYQFSRLEQNTDLHRLCRPPDNWLPTDAQLSKTCATGECTQFSSFAMAETLPDTVGEVDVISASENIKKLLKIPYSKSQVSMAVHCVGKTLLLDELDLFKHLQSATEGEREWLKTIIIQAVLSEGKNLTMNRKTNDLLSKFLYYSIGNPSEVLESQPSYDIDDLPPSQSSALIQIPDLLPKTKSEFARQVLWQFEDIRMLIGTNLPIFGEGTHPAVSLKLRDMSNPINVLTGLDYWLDNLMSNVPELAMCYHLNGIVQKYELLKTEEIPNLKDAIFAPQVVKDIAQNMLSFLKSNCTKEGHTYWLFRGQDEDVVKLYDLTSLCNDYPNRAWENPFISPVAMLLHRVAQNMSLAGPSKRDKNTIYKLLKNCLVLLDGPKNRHPEIVTSANYLLSHIFINEDDLTDPTTTPPTTTTTTSKQPRKKKPSAEPKPPPGGAEDEDDLIMEDEDNNEDDDMPASDDASLPMMDTQSLMMPSGGGAGDGFKDRRKARRKTTKTVHTSREEKARKALAYVIRGLKNVTECSDLEDTIGQQKDSKMPSPLASPTRAKPICYPCQESTPDSESQGGGNAPIQGERGDRKIAVKNPETIVTVTDREDDDLVLPRDFDQERNRGDGGVPGDEPAGGGTTTNSPKIDGQEQSSETSGPGLIQYDGTDANGQGAGNRGVLGESRNVYRAASTLDKFRWTPGEEGTAGSAGVAYRRADVRLKHEEAVPSGDLRDDEQSNLSLNAAAAKIWHPSSWQHKSTVLLLKKAWEVYLVLSTTASSAGSYGRALRFASMSLRCRNACLSLQLADGCTSLSLLSNQLAVCGDCLVLLTHNLPLYTRHREEYGFQTEDDRFILSIADQHSGADEYNWAVDFKNSIEHNLRAGIMCYTVSLSEAAGCPREYITALTRKQGNAHNELGVYYMNKALGLTTDEEPAKECDLRRKSLGCFESGIEIFECVNDAANIALLLCNIGKLMRMCAHSCGDGSHSNGSHDNGSHDNGSQDNGSEMTPRELAYYNKAADYYQKALSRLGQRKKNHYLWESVTWELSSTYFSMATILQDHPPLSSMMQEQIEKDIRGLMNKALSLCDVDDASPAKQPLYQYRVATIYHRLASMYHNAHRKQALQTTKWQHSRSLAELHYQKAIKLFLELDRPVELLRVLLEKVALYEHQIEGQSGFRTRLKSLHSALETLLQCKEALGTLDKLKTPEECTAPGVVPATDRTAEMADTADPGQERVVTDLRQTAKLGSATGRQDVDQHTHSLLEESKLRSVSSDDRASGGDTDGRTGDKVDSIVTLSSQIPVQNERQAADERLGLPSSLDGTEPTWRTALADGTVGADTDSRVTVNYSDSVDPEGQRLEVRTELSTNEEEEEEKEEEETFRLASLWVSRLQFVLLSLVKLHSSNKKSSCRLISTYKEMYMASLKPTSASPSSSSGLSRTALLTSIARDVKRLFESVQ